MRTHDNQTKAEPFAIATIQMSRQQWSLVWIWVPSFVASLAVVGYMQVVQFAVPNPPADLYKSIYTLYGEVVAFYSAFLTTMLTIAYARQSRPARAGAGVTRRSHHLFVLALFLSLAWNAAFIFFVCLSAFTDRLDVPSLTETLQQWFGRCAWLINPVVGFYFASEKA
jgi:hypothetical protein